MLIALPPSEGKSTPDGATRLDLGALLGAGQLSGAREAVMEALAAVSAGPDTAQVLGLGAKSAAEAVMNTSLRTAPVGPAWSVYTGVLYDAAGLARVAEDPASRAVMGRHVVIFSGLWGVLRPGDEIPNHRLSMGVALPGLGRLATWWKPQLRPVLREAWEASGGGVVVDCRSGAYSPAWQPAAREEITLMPVRVEAVKADGSRSVVSHFAKHTRGLLTGALVRALAAGSLPAGAGVDEVADVARGLPGVLDVELTEARGKVTLAVLIPASTQGSSH